jgi:hypothetical protein
MCYWFCLECYKIAAKVGENQFIGHGVLWDNYKVKPEELPVARDRGIDCHPCAICGSRYTEYHHWAPSFLRDSFGEDYNKWPGTWLCREHHKLWHKIVTPNMSYRNRDL